MKRSLIIALIFAFSCLNLFAKWAAASKEQLVGYSALIVVAELVSTDTKKAEGGKGQAAKQTAELKVITTLKGEAPASLEVHGEITGICKPEYIFPEDKGKRFLLFLKKAEKGYQVWNGGFASLEIVNDEVGWFDDAKTYAYERKQVSLKDVEEQIRALVAAAVAKP